MPLQDIEISLSHNRLERGKSHAGENNPVIEDEISSVIRLKGDLDTAQRDRLLKIATRCWVHRALTSKMEIKTSTDQYA